MRRAFTPRRPPPPFFRTQYAFIKRVSSSTAFEDEAFAKMQLEGCADVADVAERVSKKFSQWGVHAEQVHLFLAAAGGEAEPPPAALVEAAADRAKHLGVGLTLVHAGITPGCWLLARVPPPAAAPAGARPSVLPPPFAPLSPYTTSFNHPNATQRSAGASISVDLAAALKKFESRLDLVAYKQSHVLSRVSQQKVEAGALFYITGSGSPLLSGFFVSPRIALTTNHSAMLNTKRAATTTITGCCPTEPPRTFEFDIASTDALLDFTVLRLKPGQGDAPAFFDIPSFDAVEPGLDLGLVTMSTGSGAALEARPQISQHRVSVSGLDRDQFFLYDGASTWRLGRRPVI